MTLRRSLTVVLLLGVAGCAALPSDANFCGRALLSGDAACPTIESDGGGDAFTSPYDGGGYDVGEPPTGAGRPSLCNATPCFPDKATSCTAGDAGDASSDEACHMTLGAGQQTSAMCTTAGAGGDGASCTSGLDCAAGFECVGNGTCRHYCCDDVACTTMTNANTNYETYFCDVATEKGATGAKVPVCLVVQPCKPLTVDQCGAGETCAIVEIQDSAKLVATCDVAGKGTLGDSCELEQCSAGFGCIGATGQRTCQQLCNSQYPCGGSQNCSMKSQALSTFNVGVCGP